MSLSARSVTTKPRVAAYGILNLATTEPGAVSAKPASDSLAIMLPVTSLPQDVLARGEDDQPRAPEVIRVYVDQGSARWVGADGRSHQIGEPANPLNTEVLDALRSAEGLLVSFIDQHTGQPLLWTIFKRGPNH